MKFITTVYHFMKNPHVNLPLGTELLGYIIGQKIGQGAFGEIYCAIDQNTGLIWAFKTESNSAKQKTLQFEYQILAQVQESPYFPRLGTIGFAPGFQFISLEFLGPSLSHILKVIPEHRFKFSTGIRISYHVLKAIEDFHSHGYIHRDIKPGNILTREGVDHPLCLIDFGLSRMYKNDKTGAHLAQRRSVGFRGTRAYASLNAHYGYDLSRRDDLMSWFYLTYDQIIEPLAWRGLQNKAEILRLKRDLDICAKVTPVAPELFEIWRCISALEFTDTPDYVHIYECLDRIMKRNQIRMDEKFDWSDILYQNRQKVVKSLDGIESNIKPTPNSKRNPMEEMLITAEKRISSPFSIVSEVEEDCCCCNIL